MKYDFLVKEKLKNTSFENEDNKFIVSSTMLSTYEDFNIFIKKPNIDNHKSNELKDNKLYNIDEDKSDNINENKSDNINKDKCKKETEYTLFESEKKTVEIIVKYSSNFINLLLKLLDIIKNSFLNILSKKKINTNTEIDKKLINKFNENIKKKNKNKNNDKNKEINYIKSKKKNKDINLKKDDKYIKKINSCLLELD
jgi:hypothetical protein